MKVVFKITVSIALVLMTMTNIVDSRVSGETLNDLYSTLEEMKAEEANNSSSIQANKEKISANEAQIKAATTEIIAKQDEINQNIAEIGRLNSEIEIKREEIAELLVYYQSTQSDNLELAAITSADSIVDAIHLQSSVELLTSKSDEKIEEFIDLQAALEAANVVLNENIASLEVLQEKLTAEIESLGISINAMEAEQVDIRDQITDQEKLIAYYEDIGCKKTETLEACKERTSKVTPSASGFLSPMDNGVITAFSGWYSPWGVPRYHRGTDMVGRKNLNVYATAPGTVAIVTYNDRSRGNGVYIHHVINGKRYTSAYFHLRNAPNVKVGQVVTADTLLGIMGNTGNSTGAHLHFEILNGWIGQDFYYHSQAHTDVRNFMSFPGIRVYWEGRNR